MEHTSNDSFSFIIGFCFRYSFRFIFSPISNVHCAVIDFEATCDEASAEAKMEWVPQEIIEFPWVLIDLRSNEIIAENQIYVSPSLSGGKVSAFCTKLTGITNEILSEKGVPLQSALASFDEWIANQFGSQETGESFCIATDGPWDLQVCSSLYVYF